MDSRLNEVNKVLMDVVDRWCPTNAKEEDFTVQMSRALLNLAAFETEVNNGAKCKPSNSINYPIDIDRANRINREISVFNTLVSTFRKIEDEMSEWRKVLSTNYSADQKVHLSEKYSKTVSELYEEVNKNINKLMLHYTVSPDKHTNTMVASGEDIVTISRMEYTRLMTLVNNEYGYNEEEALEWIRDTTGTIWYSEDEWTSQKLIDDPYSTDV